MEESSKNAFKILLVEDSEADIDLVKFALKKSHSKIELDVVTDGEAALEYLFNLGKLKTKPYPSVVLLDINLPGINGIEVLHQIKETENLKHIPIVMFTSSKHDEDIINSYSYHANCFLQKPLDFKSFQSMIEKFEEFWLTTATLPKHG